MKMCKNGEWLYITIDDLFPCYPLVIISIKYILVHPNIFFRSWKWIMGFTFRKSLRQITWKLLLIKKRIS